MKIAFITFVLALVGSLFVVITQSESTLGPLQSADGIIEWGTEDYPFPPMSNPELCSVQVKVQGINHTFIGKIDVEETVRCHDLKKTEVVVDYQISSVKFSFAKKVTSTYQLVKIRFKTRRNPDA